MKQITVLPSGHKKVQTIFNEPTKTQQQFKEQCDVNNIIKKYQQTGQLLHVARSQGVYTDLTNVGDYLESMVKITKAREAFDLLPSDVRKKFQNDPSELLSFLDKKENLEEAIKLGLIEKPISNTDIKKSEQVQEKPAPTA